MSEFLIKFHFNGETHIAKASKKGISLQNQTVQFHVYDIYPGVSDIPEVIMFTANNTTFGFTFSRPCTFQFASTAFDALYKRCNELNIDMFN
jgi:hypothetical protein